MKENVLYYTLSGVNLSFLLELFNVFYRYFVEHMAAEDASFQFSGVFMKRNKG